MKKLKNVPVTNRGQWDYPGMDTIVPSGQITMKGVPYPVLGTDDTGYSMMMLPGGEYSFPGDMVYEKPMMKSGGYVVTRSNDRKGKTHKVTGPDGTVKYFGDSKLGQHPKDPERKAAFYARHKKNLDNNPYFRAFARKTWEEGGEIDEDIEMMMQNGGTTGWLDRYQMGGDAKSTIDPAVLNSKDRTIVPDVLYPTKVFYEDYMNSPRYLEMLEGKKDAEYIDQNRFKNLVKSSDNLHSLPDEMWNKNVPQDVMGFSVAGTGDIFVEPEFAEDYSEKLKDYQRELSDMSPEELAALKENNLERFTNMRDAQDEIMTHEMSHTTDRPVSNGFRLIPEEDELEIRRRTAGSKKEFDDAKNIGAWEYLTEPTEIRARLNAIRKDLFDKGFDIGNKKVNTGDLKDLKTEGLKDLKKVTTDADIIWMLNNISSNTSEPQENYAKYGGQHGGLDRWFAEKWVDVKTGKACGRQEGEKRKGYPACRPSKRVSADTPKTASELSASEKAKFKREKTSSQRINYNHKKEEGGEIGWLDKYK